VVGLARSGIAAARALRERGAEVIGVDAGTPSAAGSLAAGGVEVHVGEDGVALLDRVHTVVKSPGVPAEAPVVMAARSRGLQVIGELELAWRMLENEFIAVTGTNGKTTTVELIGHIHREAGLPVAVAGNVGAAVSGLVGAIDEDATVVCEVSSFQLEDALAFAPEAAVLLNVEPDHLDRHATFDAYVEAKLSLFAHQDSDDVAVAPSALVASGLGEGEGSIEDRIGKARRVLFGCGPRDALLERDGELSWEGRPLLASGELGLRGRHNVHNAMAAAAVCLVRGIARQAVADGLRSFSGVAHRLEEVTVRAGVLFVNDSKATNVASTLVALDALADAGPVHLILGGQGKGQDFAPLRAAVERSCRAVYVIGEDAPTIARAIVGGAVPVRECGDLRAAVEDARRAAVAGEVVLLSPSCASFDQFTDFEARGECFRELVGS
jgi:UDP-N-acetylmuramoylalanine--D-glutamate ligase